MKVLSDRDAGILAQLHELAGSTAVFDAALSAVAAIPRRPMLLADVMREIVSRREPFVQDALRSDSRLAALFGPAPSEQ